MKSLRVIVRKELSAYFLSPVALIFLAIFLGATVCIFFTFAKFFARNLADVRPLFSWLPILLIFLVSAITMRQWSEEQKLGTLEILLTLPMRTRDLVVGKFLAGMVLVALALVLTIPLPVTVAQLGQLDWGPVIGGYIAALLLASAYMAIGLCVSARTDNQIVSLMVTLTIGGALYLIGAPAFTDFFGTQVSEVLRSIGTGSRFESIERGVLDFRDFFTMGASQRSSWFSTRTFSNRNAWKHNRKGPSQERQPYDSGFCSPVSTSWLETCGWRRSPARDWTSLRHENIRSVEPRQRFCVNSKNPSRSLDISPKRIPCSIH